MTDPATPSATPKMLTLTAQIVVAHVGANKVPAADVPALINNVYGALLHADAPRTLAQQPAVPINRSIQREYLVCLENGAKLKLMKRYLQAQFGLTPDAYRAKWGLPRNYPMVAPAFAAQRSALAKQLGLGNGVSHGEEGEVRSSGNAGCTGVRYGPGRSRGQAHSGQRVRQLPGR